MVAPQLAPWIELRSGSPRNLEVRSRAKRLRVYAQKLDPGCGEFVTPIRLTAKDTLWAATTGAPWLDGPTFT